MPIARTTSEAINIAKRRGGAIAVWATRIPAGLVECAERAAIPVWRIEDGFIRSVGLGAALHLPCSIVVDRSGIYYDPSAPSDLESILESRVFSEIELSRAAALIETLIATGVTKYNLGGRSVDLPKNRSVSLVIGQVSDDASMQFGSAGVDSVGLIEKARSIDPAAYLVYKPHPDVVAGLRKGLIDADVDMVVADGDLLSMLDHVDTVHTISSLAGFEALLRGKTVHVHGQPFYAGWGLTIDHNPPMRRQRRLDLRELVAGTLIAYPRYCHPDTGSIIEVEELVMLLKSAGRDASRPGRIRRLVGMMALAIAGLRDTK